MATAAAGSSAGEQLGEVGQVEQVEQVEQHLGREHDADGGGIGAPFLLGALTLADVHHL